MSPPWIDLRSDTVTRPSAPMRRAMAEAEVGDDVYGEDPTTNRLQELAAGQLGKEAAIFVLSGTMGNELALMAHAERGDEIVTGQSSHIVAHEAGAPAALSGALVREIGHGGLFTEAEFVEAIRPAAYYMPRTRVVVIENTHNRAGGRIFPQKDLEAICAAARQRGILSHLDGARLFNAAIGSGRSAREIARPFDSVTFCFSKGLGAPAGSLILGARPFIERVRRYRRMVGGALRQAGVLAAAALWALEHNVERLAEDHDNARRLARLLAGAPGARVDPAAVETNIVNVETSASAEIVVGRARERGVLISAIGPGALRAVTHLDVSTEQIDRAGEILAALLSNAS